MLAAMPGRSAVSGPPVLNIQPQATSGKCHKAVNTGLKWLLSHLAAGKVLFYWEMATGGIDNDNGIHSVSLDCEYKLNFRFKGVFEIHICGSSKEARPLPSREAPHFPF